MFDKTAVYCLEKCFSLGHSDTICNTTFRTTNTIDLMQLFIFPRATDRLKGKAFLKRKGLQKYLLVTLCL